MADPFKLVILPATKAGMSRAALQHYLEHDHGPLVMSYADVGGRFMRYEHHYVESEPVLATGGDAVTIISFASVADMVASKASDNYRLYVGPDEDNFRDEAASRAYSAQPRVIRDGPRDAPCKVLILRRLRDDADAPVKWEDHVATVLGAGEHDVLRVVVNRLSPLGGPGDYDMLDEISLADAAHIPEIVAVLERTPDSLLAAPGVALVTRTIVFV